MTAPVSKHMAWSTGTAKKGIGSKSRGAEGELNTTHTHTQKHPASNFNSTEQYMVAAADCSLMDGAGNTAGTTFLLTTAILILRAICLRGGIQVAG